MKKLLILVGSLCLALGMMAACGDKKDDSDFPLPSYSSSQKSDESNSESDSKEESSSKPSSSADKENDGWTGFY